MRYKTVREGIFLSRPNRFVACVELDGKKEKVHVKNTGRCRELLKEGATVWLEQSDNPNRSTAYDLVTVRKGERLVGMDSTAPNRAAEEWLRAGGLYPDAELIQPERTYGNSRFDFYIKTPDREVWMEVKGVNLEEDNTALFPDAPSLRALKHVDELVEARRAGYEAVLLFVVQMEGICRFMPNRQTQPEFARALLRASREGVKILARGCTVFRDGMEISYEIPVVLEENGLFEIAAPLLKWYDENRRSLPWRDEPTPYRVWISEIMLQQTRVEAVRPYFERFMKALPDIAALAETEEEQLLKLWEGLGYYSRARNLKKAAQTVTELYGGCMPSRPEELMRLPGIGSYTAGAVSSIAYGQRVPAVDGNVLRILARYREDGRDILKASVKKSVEEELLPTIPEDRPGDFNQALMDLGAMVCLPGSAPRCGSCPLGAGCLARLHQTQAFFPRKAEKKKRAVEKKTILVIQDGSRAAIRRRPDRGLLAGMYEFPSLPGHVTQEEVLGYLKEKGLSPIRISLLPESKHIFSHREWHMTGYAVRVDELEPCEKNRDGFLFVEPSQTEERYPIPSAFSAYTRYLRIRIGNEKYEEQENAVVSQKQTVQVEYK